MARFSSVMFPVFFWLGATIPPRRATDWTTVFAICQGYVAVMFFTWREMF